MLRMPCVLRNMPKSSNRNGVSGGRISLSKMLWLCVNCGLCSRACQIGVIKENGASGNQRQSCRQYDRPPKLFGRISPAAGRKVLAAGGVVYGAVFDAEKKKEVPA